jgi:hypothetical protein
MLGGTVNSVNIVDSTYSPVLNITGLDVALTDLIEPQQHHHSQRNGERAPDALDQRRPRHHIARQQTE